MEIKFNYADKVVRDKDREARLSHLSKVWFEPLLNEIDQAEGNINFFLNQGDETNVSFSGINIELAAKMQERLKLFHSPRK
jgi:hypothetical protein